MCSIAILCLLLFATLSLAAVETRAIDKIDVSHVRRQRKKPMGHTRTLPPSATTQSRRLQHDETVKQLQDLLSKLEKAVKEDEPTPANETLGIADDLIGSYADEYNDTLEMYENSTVGGATVANKIGSLVKNLTGSINFITEDIISQMFDPPLIDNGNYTNLTLCEGDCDYVCCALSM